MRSRLLVAVLVPLIGCQPQAGRDTEEESPQTADASDARSQIERLRNDWIAAAERDDAATIAPMYAEDAVMVGTGNPPARGREAIQAALTQDFPGSRNLRVESRDLTVSGDLAYDYGEFSVQATPPGGREQTESGHYIVVLKRQPDGNWKIVKHLSTMPSVAAASGTTTPTRRAD